MKEEEGCRAQPVPPGGVGEQAECWMEKVFAQEGKGDRAQCGGREGMDLGVLPRPQGSALQGPSVVVWNAPRMSLGSKEHLVTPVCGGNTSIHIADGGRLVRGMEKQGAHRRRHSV